MTDIGGVPASVFVEQMCPVFCYLYIVLLLVLGVIESDRRVCKDLDVTMSGAPTARGHKCGEIGVLRFLCVQLACSYRSPGLSVRCLGPQLLACVGGLTVYFGNLAAQAWTLPQACLPPHEYP